METLFIIKNLETNLFYGNYRIDNYWTKDLNEVDFFKTKEAALKTLQDPNLTDFFFDSIVSIEEIYKL